MDRYRDEHAKEMIHRHQAFEHEKQTLPLQ